MWTEHRARERADFKTSGAAFELRKKVMKLLRSSFGGTAVLPGDQRENACLTVWHHCEESWQRSLSPPTENKYGLLFGENSNCTKFLM